MTRRKSPEGCPRSGPPRVAECPPRAHMCVAGSGACAKRSMIRFRTGMSEKGPSGSGNLPRARPAPVSPGDVLAGKYRVDRVLGAGGMGVVVAATQAELDRKVA